MHPEKITKADKNIVNDLDYEGIKFPVSKKKFDKFERKNNICINVFCYENNLVYPVHILGQKFKDCINLLFIADENKPHYVYIKDFNRFMYNKTRCKNKKITFANVAYNVLVVKILAGHREACLKINGKQTVKLRNGSIKVKNQFKQLAVAFNI